MKSDYNHITEYEFGVWHGAALGLVAGVVLTLWIVSV